MSHDRGPRRAVPATRPMVTAVRAFLALWAVLVLGACSSNTEEAGIVARVNGRPITLHQLELKYDFMHLGWGGDINPTVARLREDYGQVLGDLVVQTLLDQELERRGMSVTDEELKAAEDEIRADYPEGTFEQVLVEEYIDIRYWREELRARLAMEKFFSDVLRPQIRLDYQEAEAYYREHVSDFYLPARVRFHLVRGPSRELVESALKLYRETGDVKAVEGKFNKVTVRELKMREDRLTADWAAALKGLEPGQAGPILSDDTSYMALVFLERSSARVLDPSRAYPVVEKVLLEEKLREAFQQWLAGEMRRAEIVVSPHLKLDAEAAASEAGAAGTGVGVKDVEEPGVAPPGVDGQAPPLDGGADTGVEQAPPDVGPDEGI